MSAEKETFIKIDDSGKDTQKNEVNILCLDLTSCSKLTQFTSCCVFVFFCYLGYGYFLEIVFTDPEVKSISLYITLVQFIVTTLLSYTESVIRSPIKRKVPLSTYCLLALLTLGTMVFSNLSLSYLNYPTQLIFKSCKLIPVMIGSIIILGKKYGFLDYVAAIIMCIGLTMFTLADSETSPNFDVVGVLIISAALLCDAVIGNVQEKAMKQFRASNNEVVFYSYAIGSIYLFIITGSTGILTKGISALYDRGIGIYSNILLISVTGYVGLQAVLTLVRICGATVAVTVTTMRKVVSIVISFLLFEKPFVFQYVWSGLLVALAIYLNHYSKKRPSYVPRPALFCWKMLQNVFESEYRYLQAISVTTAGSSSDTYTKSYSVV